MRSALPAILLALAGIAAPASAEDISAKVYSDRVVRLTEVQRLGVMRRAILDAGETCERPYEARPQQTYKNLIMWTTRCKPAGDFAVFIGPNALVQVRACGQLAQLKLPICALPPRAAVARVRR